VSQESVASEELDLCLPEGLRGPGTRITRVAAGLSGAGVYRVEAEGRSFVLKVAGTTDPVSTWRRRCQTQTQAAQAGLAPAIVHVDESRRAVLSEFVVDRSFPMYYGDPRTRDSAIAQLGGMLRRLHALPLPPDAETKLPRDVLSGIWSGLSASQWPSPAFAAEAVQRVLSEVPPASDCPLVLSHNDVNPTNLVYDGEGLLLLDWDTAGPNDPLYDPAAISVFLRMDESGCRGLLSAYEGRTLSSLPERFAYQRRLVAALCGALFLHLARHAGHPGAGAEENQESTPALGDVYQQLRSGALSMASAAGKWRFGLALLKESLQL
jgi:aminoglycoside phosphotransferase (APT) family kinase protein